MMLKVLGSSSKGNCYLLKSETETLILEAGLPSFEIKKGLGFSFKNVVGCLITHEHLDHCKSALELIKMGVNIYTSTGTANAIGIDDSSHRLIKIQAGNMFEVGSFKVIPFKLEHDAAEPLGFIINHCESGNILFITDSFFVRDTFKNIHHILIEANFSKEIIDRKVNEGATPDFLKNRIFKSHMSLETCKKTLSSNDLSKVQNIILIHLSDGNSNANQFKYEVERLTGKRTFIADAGLTIDLKKTPF